MNFPQRLPNPVPRTLAIITVISLTLIGLPLSQGAAFMKLGDITGEAVDSQHQGWIDVLNVDWGIRRSSNGGNGQNRDLGDISSDDLQVIIPLDSSSASIAQAALNGTPIPQLEIDLTASYTQGEFPYITYKLKNVIITSYSIKGRNKNNEGAVVVTLGYTEIEWTYYLRDAAGTEISQTKVALGGQEGEE